MSFGEFMLEVTRAPLGTRQALPRCAAAARGRRGLRFCSRALVGPAYDLRPLLAYSFSICTFTILLVLEESRSHCHTRTRASSHTIKQKHENTKTNKHSQLSGKMCPKNQSFKSESEIRANGQIGASFTAAPINLSSLYRYQVSASNDPRAFYLRAAIKFA